MTFEFNDEPSIYRAIIDNVIDSIKKEFDDYGVGQDVLNDLQTRWENKVVASRVAEFETPAPAPPPPPQQQATHLYPPHVPHNGPHPGHQLPPGYTPTYLPPPAPMHPQVKSEPADGRYLLPPPNGMPYTLPSLPGPQLTGARLPTMTVPVATPFNPSAGTTPNGASRPSYQGQAPTAAPGGSTQAQQQQQQQRIPQVDGPSSDSSGSPSPPPSQQSYAPRTAHPSLPQPAQAQNERAPGDSEEINSDLDDSDTDGEEEDQEGALGETDIVFCTYDKVARVKNKWKCVLKDGMIHVNNKDYLFAKCTCEFEW